MALVSLTCFFRHAHAEKEETEPPKTKYYSGEAIEGAVLQLIDKDGKVVKEWTTTKAAYEIGAELVAGETYILHEKSAPPGYLLAEDITFTVPLDGKKQEITMVEAPTSVEIEKKDKDTAEPVYNAVLQVLDENCAAMGRLNPKKIAPMIVDADLDIPGHMARHWKRPTPMASFMVISSGFRTMEDFPFCVDSAVKMSTEPTIKAVATLAGLKR